MRRSQGRLTVIVLLLLFTITNINLAVSPAAAPFPPEPPPPIKAILKTADNRPISVNGANAMTGATVLTGAVIETPDQVGAVISLGAAGELEIEPNTKLTLEFDENGNMKVTLVRGCTTARTKKNIIAEIQTEQGVAGTTDPNKKKALTVCYPPGSPAPIVSIPAGAAATGHGSLIGAILGGGYGGIITAFFLRGDNPSQSSP